MYNEFLQSYIDADVHKTLGISFFEFINVTKFEMNMILKACCKHRDAKIAIQKEQLAKFQKIKSDDTSKDMISGLDPTELE